MARGWGDGASCVFAGFQAAIADFKGWLEGLLGGGLEGGVKLGLLVSLWDL